MKKIYIFWMILGLGFVHGKMAGQCNIYVANATPCGGTPVDFSITNPSGGGYSWDFDGDGNADEFGTNVTYIFPDTNMVMTHLVSLYQNGTVCDNQVMTVQAAPDPSIGVLPGSGIMEENIIRTCSSLPQVELEIYNASSTFSSNLSYVIYWGDGTVETFYNSTFPATGFISHTYNGFGYYSLSIEVTSANGCVNVGNYIFYNGGNPSVGLATPGNTTGLCAPATVDFPITNTNMNPTGTVYEVYVSGALIESYTQEDVPGVFSYTFWESSCGLTTSTGNYQNAYDVQIIATNPCGSSQATIEPIEINTPMELSVDSDGGAVACTGGEVTFSSESQGAGEVISGNPSTCSSLPGVWTITPGTPGVHWVITEGNVFSDEVSIQFLIPGDYTITYEVDSPSCGLSSASQSISIVNDMTVDATMSMISSGGGGLDGCVETSAFFENNSTGDDLTFYWVVEPEEGWAFAPGYSMTTTDAEVNFLEAGEYDVTLYVSNDCGTLMWDTMLVILDVPEVTLAPINDFCNYGILNFDPSNFQIQNNFGNISSIVWNFPGGNPSTFSGEFPTAVTYNSLGNFQVEVAVMNECGTTTATQEFSIYSPDDLVMPPDVEVCESDAPFSLNVNISGGTWSGNGVSVEGIFTPSINNVGTNELTYSYPDNHCSLEATMQVTVLPPPAVDAGATQTTCISEDNLIITGGTPIGGIWTVDNGGVIIGNEYFDVDASGVGDFTLTYSYTGPDGCSAEATKSIIVFDLPEVDAGPSQSMCNNNNDFTMSGFSPGGGTWSGTGVSVEGIFNATNTPGPGTYTLYYVYTDALTGCSNMDSLLFTVEDNLVPDAGPDRIVCITDAPFALDGASPPSGVWSGAGVDEVGGVFDPAAAGAGVHNITYTTGFGVCEVSDVVLIGVGAVPEIILPPDQQICINDENIDLSFVQPPGGTWSGLGMTGNVFSPTDAGVGLHTLTYSFEDTLSGCSNVDNFQIEIFDIPEVSATDTSYCNSSEYFHLPEATPAGGEWSGQGVDNNLFNPQNAGGEGFYNITYTFVDADGCSNSTDILVEVFVPLEVFAGNDFELCENANEIDLSQIATPSGGTWNSNGNIGLDGAIFHPTLAGVGEHILTYIMDIGNCQVTDTLVVTIHPQPIVEAGDAVATCMNEGEIILLGTPIGGTWTANNGGVLAGNIFDPEASGEGTFSLTYTFTDPLGCANSDDVLVTVHPFPNINSNISFPDTVCRNELVQFQNLTPSGNQFFWNFGDGTTSGQYAPTHSYDAVGNYEISLNIQNEEGCGETILDTITVIGLPNAFFTIDTTEACAGVELMIQNESQGNGLTYHWDFGDGQTSDLEHPQNLTYQEGFADSTYIITLMVSNTCGTSSFQDIVTIYPHPQANIGLSPQNDCSPLQMDFANSTLGSATSYFWDFGNGNISEEFDPPSQIYVADSLVETYTVTLIATNICSSDTATTEVQVDPPNAQSFFAVSEKEGCGPLTVTFTNYATPGANIDWDFGDGNTSSLPNPTHTFDSAGVFTVIQYASADCGVDTTSVTITVLPGPHVEFAHAPTTCHHDEVVFENLSEDVTGNFWDFGDGNTSTLTNPTHTYSEPGEYIVKLMGVSAFDQCEAIDSSVIIVLEPPAPAVDASGFSGCEPLEVTFANSSIGGTFYHYDFGDSTTSILENPTHVFEEAGNYLVTLTVTDANGCWADTTLSAINVYPTAIADFDYEKTSTCGLPATVEFENLSTQANNFFWLFGDAAHSIVYEPTYVYQNHGTHPIQLIANNEFGCADTTFQVLTIDPLPEAEFEIEATEGCAPLDVYFSNTSSTNNFSLWKFGDGVTSQETYPTHRYEQSGVYDVELIVSNDNICFDTIRKENLVEVFPTPFVDFEIEEIGGGEYQMINLSQGGTTFFWEFSDGETSEQENPRHRFLNGGNQGILLEVSNEFGCLGEKLKPFFPETLKGLFIPNAFSPENGLGEVTLFKPKGVGIKEYHIQVFSPYGQLLWESTALEDGQPSEAWDGTYQGKLMAQDVYVWKCQAIFKDNTTWQGMKKGNGGYQSVGSVTLLR